MVFYFIDTEIYEQNRKVLGYPPIAIISAFTWWGGPPCPPNLACPIRLFFSLVRSISVELFHFIRLFMLCINQQFRLAIFGGHGDPPHQ